MSLTCYEAPVALWDRCKTIAETSDSTCHEMIAELQHERDAAQTKADEAAAALERLRVRGFFACVFGGAG
jgi:predicted DNA-binding ribbon-helix-helix protein